MTITNYIVTNPCIAAFGIFVALATGCGSNSSSGTSTTPDTKWVRGVYEPNSTFKNYCALPRSGNNPLTEQPYPDRQGEVAHENHFLRSWVYESYLWYDELPDENPNEYAVPEEYFALLKTDALTANGSEKDRFHFAEDELISEQFTQAGETGGYGFNWMIAPDRRVYITYIDEGSPAAKANLSRGMELISVDNMELGGDDIEANRDRIVSAAQNPELGDSHTFVFRTLEGNHLSQQLTSSTVSVSPVYLSKTLNTPNGLVGYIMLNTFSSIPAQDKLKAVFEGFSSQGIDELIVDLRYNGGGLATLSSQLAYLTVGSAATENEIYVNFRYSDKQADLEESYPFFGYLINYDTGILNRDEPLTPVDVNRVYVLTTGNTCSASESYINGLRGIGFNVIQIGDTTCGKPYGFESVANCGIEYFSINFETANAEGFGSYSDGFEPVNSGGDPMTNKVTGCKVQEDLSQPLGSENEALLGAALFHRENGRCPAAVQGQQKSQKALHANGYILVPESQKVMRIMP